MTLYQDMRMLLDEADLLEGSRVRVNVTSGIVIVGTLVEPENDEDLPAALILDAEASEDFPAQRIVIPWHAVTIVRPATEPPARTGPPRRSGSPLTA